jgi:drug/metabolite transporter (DMT)-like permease
MNPHAVSRVRVLATALLFSTSGAAIKACSLTNWQVAGFRSAIAALAVLLMIPSARRRWSWPMMGVGATYAATMILFVSANKLTTAANTIFLQATAPFYILLLSPWLLGESIRRRDLIFMLAPIAGLSMVFLGANVRLTTAPDPFRGNIFAALSGLCWALTLMGLRWLGRREGRDAGSSVTAVVIGNVIAFLVCLPWAVPLAGRPTDWLILAYLGVFQVGLAYVSLTGAMRHVPALEASLLLLLEPVLNPIWAWLVHGEQPGAWSLGGGAIILATTTIKTIFDVRARPSA